VTKAPPSADFRLELPTDRGLRLGAERLQQAISELPLRYAPFYARLSSLWQLSLDDVRAELLRARDPGAWSHGLLPGLRIFNVGGSQAKSPRARLLRFAPGARFPRHRHRESERVLVLEGGYADDSGAELHAGGEQTMAAGSEHELYILGSEPCVVAVSERGIAFTSWWLRWLNLLRR
jgi:putative transcriptional regulator